jgi:hypothetical protein
LEGKVLYKKEEEKMKGEGLNERKKKEKTRLVRSGDLPNGKSDTVNKIFLASR